MRTTRRVVALLAALAGCLGAVAYAAAPRQPSPPAPGPARVGGGALPKPSLTQHPDRLATSASARFGFAAGGRQPRFQCRLDGRSWSPCRPPVVFNGLSFGAHRFAVRAVGPGGEHGRPRRFRWRVLEPKDFSIAPRLSGLGDLYPGASPLQLPLTISNPNPVPIFVTSLSVAATAGAPGCASAANLVLTASGVSSAAPLRHHGAGDPAARPPCQPGRLPGLYFPPRLLRERARMRRTGTGIIGFAALAFLAALVSASALAYFTTNGAGNASASVSQLAPPSIAAATPSPGGTVALSWSAVTPPGSGTVTYTVSRNGGGANGTCATALTATTCTDSGLPVGTYGYVVTAKWRSWTAASPTKSASVTIGVADRLVLAAESVTPTAGAADNLTVTAKDAAGNTVTSYTGSHSLTFSGASASPGGNTPTVVNSSGTAVGFGSATALNFTSGIASVSSAKNGVMKLYASGAAGIEASDGSIATKQPLSVTVAPSSASKLVLTAATTTPTAGAADNLTTTAQDTYGNTATSYTGSHSLTYSGASASPGGNTPTVSDSSGNEVAFGTATPTNFSAGVASVSGGANGAMKLYKSGAATVQVSDGTFSTTLATTTTAAGAVKLLLAAATTTPVAAASDNLTITAQDAYTNTATSYTGTHNLTFSGSSASPSGTLPTVVNSSGTAVGFGSATALSFASGVASVSSSKNGVMKLNRAGSASLAVSDGTISNPTPLAVTVSVGAAARFGLTSISVSAGSLGANCLFTCTLTGLGNSGTVSAKVAVTDSVGNTVSALGSGHVVKITTSGSGTISGTPLAIPSTGAAETATAFTFTAKSSGSFTETLTAAASEGTAYTSATLTASR
jgi:hypothetical protein